MTPDQLKIDACPHRSMVTTGDLAPVARVWLLADDATPAAIPSPVLDEAVKLVLAGKGILILALALARGAWHGTCDLGHRIGCLSG